MSWSLLQNHTRQHTSICQSDLYKLTVTHRCDMWNKCHLLFMKKRYNDNKLYGDMAWLLVVDFHKNFGLHSKFKLLIIPTSSLDWPLSITSSATPSHTAFATPAVSQTLLERKLQSQSHLTRWQVILDSEISCASTAMDFTVCSTRVFYGWHSQGARP